MNNNELVKLAAYIAENYYDDPAGYSMDIVGIELDPWQVKTSLSVRDNRRTAVGACHGPGKTLLAVILIKWWMATRGYPRIRSTANTEKQVMSILWSELAKVHRMSKDKDLYEWTKTGYFLKDAPDVHWAQAIAWSENNSEAFAGLHAPSVLYVFDESSAIPDIIWEVAQGAMTNPKARWLALGNRTRNTGRFNECFGKNKLREGDTDTSRWNCFTIAAKDSPRVSQQYVDEIAREYGIDSDPYRVRVLGLPPQQAESQFIAMDVVDDAIHRDVVTMAHEPRILGIDPSRFGEDSCPFVDRKGRKATLKAKLHGQDTMKIVGKAIELINYANKEEHEPYDYIVVDEIGIGAGVVDRLKEQGYKVIGVNVGEKARMENMKNLRAELWQRTKDWLSEGSITEDFKEDLIGPLYSFDSSGRLVIERKEDMKKRGLASPDCLVAGTMILTPAGEKAIETLKQGDLVVTSFGNRPVIATWEKVVPKTIITLFSNGSALKSTPTHKIYTDEGYREAELLFVNSKVECISITNLLKWRLLDSLSTVVRSIGQRKLVDTIIMSGERTGKSEDGHSIDLFGNSTTRRKSLLDAAFTTLMAIFSIMRLATFSLWKVGSISGCTCEKDLRMLDSEKRIWRLCKKHKNRPRYGILLQKELKNTERLGELLGQRKIEDLKRELLSVPNVGKNEKYISQRPGFVREPALSVSRIVQGATAQRKEFVSSVVNRLWQIADAHHNVVVEAVVPCSGGETVYNLTVGNDSCYYANGILVANCADALAMTLYITNPIKTQMKMPRQPVALPRYMTGRV